MVHSYARSRYGPGVCCYAFTCSARWYRPTDALKSLWIWYAHATQCPVLTQRAVLSGYARASRSPVLSSGMVVPASSHHLGHEGSTQHLGPAGISLRAFYAKSGTNEAYGAQAKPTGLLREVRY
eukprot:2271804-Rhodomonas_salina.1